MKAAALSSPVEAGEEDLLNDDDGEEEREVRLSENVLLIAAGFCCFK